MSYALGPHMTEASGTDFAVRARDFFGNLQFEFHDERENDAHLLSAMLGGCRLSRVQTSPQGVLGARVAQKSYDVDSIKFILQMEGRSTFNQDGISLIVSPRHWIVYDPTRPYYLNNTTKVAQLLLQVPRINFSTSVLDYLRHPLLFGDEAEGLPRIIGALLRSTIEEAGRLDDAARSRVGETLIRLAAALVVPEEEGEHERDSMSLKTLRGRVKAYVEANLARGNLDIDEIARRMGCSRRYVFRAFEADDTTPAQYIWDLRLDRARARLMGEGGRPGQISEVAFACGFSSTAHFSRAFRKRYGCAPREARPGLAAAPV